MFYILHN